MTAPLRRRSRRDRGSALIEGAIVLPILLLLGAGVFELAYSFQTWQVLTNAAREGARIAIIEGSTDAGVISRVREYLTGTVADPTDAAVVVDRNVTISGTAGKATSVTVTCPFQFTVLQPVARLVVWGATVGPVSLHARATMRNEGS